MDATARRCGRHAPSSTTVDDGSVAEPVASTPERFNPDTSNTRTCPALSPVNTWWFSGSVAMVVTSSDSAAARTVALGVGRGSSPDVSSGLVNHARRVPSAPR